MIKRKPRQSFVFFVNPDDEVTLRPALFAEGEADEKDPLERFRNEGWIGLTAKQYQKRKFDQTYGIEVPN